MEKFSLEKHWDGFLNGKIAVNCPTEELANEFLQWCHSGGLKWGDGVFLWEGSCFHLFISDTTYGIDHNKFFVSDISCWEDDNYQVVEFCGFH